MIWVCFISTKYLLCYQIKTKCKLSILTLKIYHICLRKKKIKYETHTQTQEAFDIVFMFIQFI